MHQARLYAISLSSIEAGVLGKATYVDLIKDFAV